MAKKKKQINNLLHQESETLPPEKQKSSEQDSLQESNLETSTNKLVEPRIIPGHYPKSDPKDPGLNAVEIDPYNDIGFTTSFIRVGTGGTFIQLMLRNSQAPITFKNIKDGEILWVQAHQILDSDCSNIVCVK